MYVDIVAKSDDNSYKTAILRNDIFVGNFEKMHQNFVVDITWIFPFHIHGEIDMNIGNSSNEKVALLSQKNVRR